MRTAPVLVVFDLDACCWYPEMYMLWGGGAPFRVVHKTNTLLDARGTSVRLLADVRECFAHLHTAMSEDEPLIAAIASRSDEPAWARECLAKFEVKPGVAMADVVPERLTEIYKGSKVRHLQELQRKTNVPFSRTCFFDDDPSNVADVSALGVHCILTPKGVTRALFERGLEAARRG